MSKQSKNDEAVAVGKMLTGTQKQHPNGSQQLTLGSETVTVNDVTSAMQTLVTNRANTEAAQNAATEAVATENQAAPRLRALIGGFTKYVRATVGTSTEGLAIYGLTPPKVPAPRTATEKAVAAAKAQATRQARGITSAKKKQSIKGNVAVQLVVSPASPPAAAGAAVAAGASGTSGANANAANVTSVPSATPRS